MPRDLYKVSADYSLLEKKHVLTNKGIVKERNHVTIAPFSDIFKTDGYFYNDSNFRFSVSNTVNLKKKHTRKNWTLGTSAQTGTNTVKSRESRIELKPNYGSMRDFAYYGSAMELVRGTLNRVILTFPAELYFDEDGVCTNGYGIDIYTTNLSNQQVENPLKYFCLSYGEYTINGAPVTGWNVTVIDEGKAWCEDATLATVEINSITITVKRKNNKIVYEAASGTTIRPKQIYLDKFYAETDDFVRVILNRDSNPIYKATFETPMETDTGYSYTNEDYIWPTVNNYNPDVESAAFDVYYMKLSALALHHDEFDSDNMWRSMTHEAIKNLDWTFMRTNTEGETTDESKIDSSRVKAMLRIYGRSYDDMKRCIDGIKQTTTTTYDEKCNIPDYNLTDLLELDGWDITHISPKGTDSIFVTPEDHLYCGTTKSYDETDVNLAFLRRLKLNSGYLHQTRGTRKGLAALLGLFGMEEGVDFDMTEYIVGVGQYINPKVTVDGKEYTVMEINEARDGFNFNKPNGYEGYETLMVREFVYDDEGHYYLVPWYSPGYDYDGTYFQMNGGWGKRDKKKINLGMTNVTSITAAPASDIYLYDETVSYLKFAADLDDLLELGATRASAGDICYVSDLTGIETRYSEEIDVTKVSHYFILQDKRYLTILGGNGWKNVSAEDIENGTTTEAKKIIYLESILDDNKGNNPHTGNGRYDDGKEYLLRLNQVFRTALSNGQFSRFEDCSPIACVQFNLTNNIEDNKKCHNYHDDNEEGRELPLLVKVEATDAITYTGASTYTTAESYSPVETEFDSSHSINEGDVESANGVVNVKNFYLTFYYPAGIERDTDLGDVYDDYIIDRVMPFVKQMVPSSAIFKYDIQEHNFATPFDSTSTFLKTAVADGVVTNNFAGSMDTVTLALDERFDDDDEARPEGIIYKENK